MVRKPVSQNRMQPPAQAAPYPTTPLSPIQRQQEATTPPIENDPEIAASTRSNFEAYHVPNPWLSGDKADWTNDGQRAPASQLPPSLRAGEDIQIAGKDKTEGIPSVLQAGSTEATPRSSLDSQSSTKPIGNVFKPPAQPFNQSVPGFPATIHPTNPFHRRQSTNENAPEQPGLVVGSNADIWNDVQAAPEQQEAQKPPPRAFTEPWMNFETSPVEPEATMPSSHPVNMKSNPFNEQVTGTVDVESLDGLELDTQSVRRGSKSQQREASDRSSPHFAEEPPLLTREADPHFPNPSEHNEKRPLHTSYDDDVGPPLPPRNSQDAQEQPPPQPPRPPKTHGVPIDNAQSQRDESATAKRARETYQIRHVNWCDATSPTKLRQSPVMVQNANGPCPLLALVNALVLSTPADYATALGETLRVREQVSLGLLLDAVIDELISRNGDLPDVSDMYAFLVNLHTGMNVNPRFVPADAPVNLMDAPIEEELPGNLRGSRKAGCFEDTREMNLYSTFAIPLIHGWMPPRNHPAFAALKRTARTYEDAQNLMFREEELEGKLRQQGLTPEEQVVLEDIGSVKYFLSSTATQLTGYGLDTMTETMAPGSIAILFRNDHFSTIYRHPKSGQLLTLVTDMGYAGHDEVVWESLVDVSGEGCEFFSGDFRPVGNNVSDTPRQSQPREDEEGWTKVSHQSHRPRPSNRQPSHTDLPPLSTLNINDKFTPLPPTTNNTEQEDYDLALAMQLQEDEEERERESAAARRREDELSQAYLNSSDASGRRTFPGFSTGARASAAQEGPTPPPRGRGSSGRCAPQPNNNGRRGGGPPTPPRKSVDGEDAPPPSYEQAAKGPAYHPPAHHPAHPHASPSPAGSGGNTPRPFPNRPNRQSSAYSEHAASYSTASPPYGQQQQQYPQQQQQHPRRARPSNASSSAAAAAGIRGGGGIDPGMVRRRSAGVSGGGSAISADEERREKDCVVM